MTAALTARARGLLVLVVGAVAATAATGASGAVVLAAPAAAALAAGLVAARPPRITVAARAEPLRLPEAATVTMTLTLESDVALAVACTPAVGARAEAERVTVALRPATPVTVRSRLRPLRWGVHDLGTMALEARHPLGMIAWHGRRQGRIVVRVYPQPAGGVRASPAPAATVATTGSHVSRARGEGIEFAEVREYRPGDRVRALNARVSARRGRPYVNDRHPERSADVVLFLDTFAGAGGPDGGGTLDAALGAATAIAEHHLARRDRVGVVRFGGMVSWLPPGLGERQRQRVADVLIESEVVLSFIPRHVRYLPPRALPPRALVIALSPLIDDRALTALIDLRRRGVDLVVVELDARPYIPQPRTTVEELALRLWTLRHEARRARLTELGAPVAVLGPGEPVQRPLAALLAWRRTRRRGVAGA